MRHWRGELSLPRSYWINCFLGNIAAAILIAVISASIFNKDEFEPALVLAGSAATWLVIGAVGFWQLVGTWRAATVYGANHPKAYWGGIAKIALVIGVMEAASSFLNTGLPQINEYYKIYAGDAEVGKYAFRVLHDGTELEFTGGITYGAAKSFTTFVDAMGGLKLVHLDSPGGRISEAIRISKIIKQTGLSTYVSNQCLSACTIIFLSGRERLISTDGKLGFHQPDFPGMTKEDRQEAIAAQERILEDLGVTRAFAIKANSAAPTDMWIPKARELLTERVATRIVDPSNYAISGFGTERLTQDQIEKMLASEDIYLAIKRVDTEAYALILDKLSKAIKNGETLSEVRSVILPITERIFSNVLPHTADAALLMYMKFKTHEMLTLSDSAPAECYSLIKPEASRDKDQLADPDVANFENDLNAQELKLKANVINNYSPNISVPAEREVAPLISLIFQRLQTRRDVAIKLLAADSVMPDQYRLYCKSWIAFNDEILNLSPSDSVRVFRYLVASK